MRNGLSFRALDRSPRLEKHLPVEVQVLEGEKGRYKVRREETGDEFWIETDSTLNKGDRVLFTYETLSKAVLPYLTSIANDMQPGARLFKETQREKWFYKGTVEKIKSPQPENPRELDPILVDENGLWSEDLFGLVEPEEFEVPEGKRDRMVGEVYEEDGTRYLRVRGSDQVFSEEGIPELRGMYIVEGSLLVFEEDPESHEWNFLENLGGSNEYSAERSALAYEIGSDPVFPEPVQKEAALLEEEGENIIKEETEKATVSALDPGWREKYRHGENRVDFRDVLTFTIDPKTAKDFDDAISLQEVDEDTVEVGVHIADVSRFVKKDGAIDKEAWERQFTAYLKGEAYPALPNILSEHLCSLVPRQDRLAFSVVFRVDKRSGARLGDPWIGRTLINSDRRFTYEEA
jgi:hypothetical protein